MAGALDGVKVLDLSNWIAGPFGTTLLGDLGADITKVDSPAGDGCRVLGPPFQKGESHFFMGLNRNKRNIIVDMKTPQGRKVVLELAEQSDVLVQNMLPGTADRYGIGYHTLCQTHPKLIYVSNTGYGPRGPLKDKPGFDLVMQGIGGVMDRGEDQPQLYPYFPPADMATGMLIAYAVCAALYHRERTGEGQLIDTSLFATMLALQSGILFFGEEPAPYAFHEIAPYFPTYRAFCDAEGKFFTVATISEDQWHRLCCVLGHEQLATDERFNTLEQRLLHAETLIQLLQQQFAKHPRDHWIAALGEAQISSGPVYTHEELRHEPQVAEMDLLPTIEHPIAGQIQMVGLPVVFHGSPARIQRPAPAHGQHTEDILFELGYSAAKIQQLTASGAVRQAPSDANIPESPF